MLSLAHVESAIHLEARGKGNYGIQRRNSANNLFSQISFPGKQDKRNLTDSFEVYLYGSRSKLVYTLEKMKKSSAIFESTTLSQK
jgi:hypothetical protein